ncbi:MAG: hypothetical protein J2P22_04085 [Nocardioides sp.]|nr:hypothetical protein [Nocardioides sp.]
MPIATPANPSDLRTLAVDLTALGAWPKPLTDVVDRLDALQAAPASARPPAVLDMPIADLEAAADRLAVERVVEIARGEARAGLRQQLATEARDYLAEHTEQVIKTLGPAFNRHAKTFLDLYAAGGRADVSDRDWLDTASEQEIALWRKAEAAAAELDRIAGARLNLSRLCGLAPAVLVGNQWSTRDHCCAAFADVDGPWPNVLDARRKWLALAPYGLALRTLEQTRKTMPAPPRPVPPPTFTVDAATARAMAGMQPRVDPKPSEAEQDDEPIEGVAFVQGRQVRVSARFSG